jgi:hypothetical protein
VQLREYKPPLIHTRRGAITVLCFTGFLFAISIRVLFLDIWHGGRPQFQWPLTFEFLPSWAVITTNIALYAYILWLGIVLYRIARGGERIVVAGWFADVLLGPVKILVSPAGVLAIRYVQTAAMAAAFFTALFLVRKPYSEPDENDTKAMKRGLLIVCVAIGIMLLVGALLYFVPLR